MFILVKNFVTGAPARAPRTRSARMSCRPAWKRTPELELIEDRCLLSTAAPVLALGPSGHVPAPLAAAPALAHGSREPAIECPLLRGPRHHHPQSSNFSLVAVNTNLPSPVARVQVDNALLVNNKTYPSMTVLEVQNQTGTTISSGQFTVNVAGSTFQRAFPAAAWKSGETLVFFATTSAQNFQFHLAGPRGPVDSIPPNSYPNVTYNAANFTTTLHNLINSSAFGGRFQLV
jgi:hypothetical protein